MGRRRALTRGVIVAALALLAVYLLQGGGFGLGSDDDPQTTSTTTSTAGAPTAPSGGQEPAPAGSGSQLSQAEAAGIAEALGRIESGEPLPYDQDGGVFQNREGLLPEQPQGHYREYTVQTPGSDDRGARRLVIGSGGETYYTADHYGSFVRIDPEDFR